MTILTLLVVCLCNILCFYIGARIGQKSARGEEIRLPNPVEAVKADVEEHRARAAAREERDRLDVILANVESYDGTGYGQQRVPDSRKE